MKFFNKTKYIFVFFMLFIASISYYETHAEGETPSKNPIKKLFNKIFKRKKKKQKAYFM